MRLGKLTPVFWFTAAVSVSPMAAWADTENPDWPCIQRKVPTLSAGMMWAGPPIGEDGVDWRRDAQISHLVERLSSRRTPVDEAIRDIDAYAAGLGKDERAEKLTLIFAGLLQKTNAERQEILDGIERYDRKQKKLAESILATRQKLEAALAVTNPTEANDEKRQSLEEELNWQTRIHEDREHSLTYICEIPVLLEQRLFQLARELANRIE